MTINKLYLCNGNMPCYGHPNCRVSAIDSGDMLPDGSIKYSSNLVYAPECYLTHDRAAAVNTKSFVNIEGFIDI